MTIAWAPLLPVPLILGLLAASGACCSCSSPSGASAPGLWWRGLVASASLLASAGQPLAGRAGGAREPLAIHRHCRSSTESPSQKIEPAGRSRPTAAFAHLTEDAERAAGSWSTRVDAKSGGDRSRPIRKAPGISVRYLAPGAWPYRTAPPGRRVSWSSSATARSTTCRKRTWAALGFDAPVHLLLTGRKDEADRRISHHPGAALRHRRARADPASSKSTTLPGKIRRQPCF